MPVEVPRRFPVAGDLAGLSALVTGGGRGLGLVMACALAAAGARVAIAGHRPEFLESGLAEVRKHGSGVTLLADLRNVDQTRHLVHAAADQLGGLDILVNNAGGGARAVPEELTTEQFDDIFSLNVRAVYFACCEAAGVMSGGGAIVNVASVVGYLVEPEMAAYSSSKAAVIQLTRALAGAWGPRQIRVNAVAPGFTDSPLNAHRKADPAKAEAVTGRTPLGRWGKPADVAQAVVFLAAPASAFITGQVLTVDGGYSLGK